MFDNIQSLYNQHLGDKGPKLKVGTGEGDIRDQALPFMFEIFGDFDTSTNATGDSGGHYLPSKSYVLPINPENYRISFPTRTNMTMTQQGAFQDNTGIGLPKISIAGTFGYLGTLVPGHGKGFTGAKKDAWGLYMDLYNTFTDFYRRFGTYSEDGRKVTKPVDLKKPPELRFYNFTDEEYWTVQVDKFELLRNVQRRFLYQYDLQLSCLKRVNGDSVKADELMEKINKVNAIDDKKLKLWGTILQGYAKANSTITTVVNAIDGIKEDFSNLAQSVQAFKSGVTTLINAPYGMVSSITDSINSITETAVSINDIPHEFVNDMRQMKRDMLILGMHEDKFSTSSESTGVVTIGTDTDTSKEIVTAEIPMSVRTQQNVSAMHIPETTLFGSSMDTLTSTPVRVHSIQDSDSIRTIAYRTLGDGRSWQQLVAMNNLEYPYIASGMAAFTPVLQTANADVIQAGEITISAAGVTVDPGTVIVINGGEESAIVDSCADGIIYLLSPLEGSYPDGTKITNHDRALAVLRPGDKIKIPGPAGSQYPVTGDAENFENLLYGTDEHIDDSGAQDASNGDVETISGVDNLVMQLRHRLMTIPGELAAVGHPEYGSCLPLYIGKIDTPVWLERAKLEAEIGILQEPRIERVSDVSLVTQGTAIFIHATVHPIGQTGAQNLTIPIL